MPDYYHSITTLHALQNAWRAVRAKNAAGGIDGFTLSHFEKRLNDNLIELQHELISQTWNPEPYLRIEITKNETEKRKLGLLCIKDKIVQQAIKTAIEPQLEKTFLNLSYGYRPNKGPERAIKRVVHDLKKLKIEFLGITISDTGLSITEKKKKTLQERINSIKFIKSSLSSQSKETLQGIKNYYAKLLPESTLKELDCFLMNRLNALIIRNQNSINNKKELVSNLQKIEFYSENSNKNKSQLIQQLCSTYIVHSTKSKTRLTSTHIDNTKLITQKKKEYQKRENEGAELVISIPGSYIGATYKGITVKLQGKIINKPSPALKHITVVGKGISLSSNAITYCMNHKIPIDFFDGRGKQYSTVLNPVFLDGTLWNKQVELPLEQKIKLATQIIIGKLKNQLNLIKYYHKYHKDILGGKLSEKYVEVVLKIDKLIEKAKNYSQRNEKYTAELMAIESQAAIAYWSYIRVLTADDGIDFIRREHQGATDLLNSLLNYGYAILYARVWKNILAAKLNPSIGVLHAKQDGKPTLVFDVVELFRAQMVDRVVISLIQKKVSLKMHDGLLNESSKRVLIRYILERLNRYEKYRGEEITFSQIILRQAQEIALFISGDNLIFKPYVAKW